MPKCDHCSIKNKLDAKFKVKTFYQEFHLCAFHASVYPHKDQLEPLMEVKNQNG